MAPIVHGLESEYAGQVQFIYLDISDPANDEFLRSLGFRGTPHFFILNGAGELEQQLVGPQTADALRASIEGNLQ